MNRKDKILISNIRLLISDLKITYYNKKVKEKNGILEKMSNPFLSVEDMKKIGVEDKRNIVAEKVVVNDPEDEDDKIKSLIARIDSVLS